MKVLTILITIFSFLLVDTGERYPNIFYKASLQACPEQEAFDWVAINLFLTSDNLEQQRTKSGVSSYAIDETKLGSILGVEVNWEPRTQEDVLEYWNALGAYWQKRGVEHISDPKVCEVIGEALSTDISLQTYKDTHVPRAYYKIDNKYLVIYKSNKPGTGRTPVRLLNEDFRIISRFSM